MPTPDGEIGPPTCASSAGAYSAVLDTVGDAMTFLQALVLGILQGATEFLPVSSSGHLVLVPWLAGWPDAGLTFNAVVHLGTFLAVIACFWGDVMLLVRAWCTSVRHRRMSTPEERLAWLIVLSAVPAALAGYLLKFFFEALFGSPGSVAGLLIVTGIILLLGERASSRQRDVSALRVPDALLIGLAQAMAIAPGISRSGATISAGRVTGLSREGAARFSFVMGIPVIAGAAALEVLDALRAGTTTDQTLLLVTGFVTAGLAGYLSIRGLLRMVRTRSLRPFAYYCWAIGLLGLVAAALF